MRSPRWGLLFAVSVAFAISLTGTSRLCAQTTVQIGGFNVEFWDQADGDVPIIGDGVFSASLLDTFSSAEKDAITHAFEYWSDKLNLSPADANSPVIRVIKDIGNSAPENAFGDPEINNLYFGESETNIFTRLVRGLAPTRYQVGTEQPVDGEVVFNPGSLGDITSNISQLPHGAYDLEMVAIHEVGHLLGFDPYNQPFTDYLTPSGSGYLFGGAPGGNAEAVYGGKIPIAPDAAHTLLPYANLTRALVQGKDYRNIPFFSPAELAIMADMGYNINLSQQFGKTYYQNNVTDNNSVAFNSTSSFGLGMFIEANNLNITQAVDLNANGYAGAGIRISGGFNNRVTLAPGVTVNANGDQGVGVFASGGANQHLILRGDVNATGSGGIGALFDFGPTFIFSDLTSADFGAPLISQLDISGSISGDTDAIMIDNTAGIGEINVMQGASLSGDMVSNALVDPLDNINRPTINFGYLADANGAKTMTGDSSFNFSYDGNITGSTRMDANLIDGITSFNGAVNFQSLNIAQQATLGGTGTISSTMPVFNNGTIAPGNSIGTLHIQGDLINTPTSTFDIQINNGGTTPGVNNDLILVSGSTVINGGTIDILNAPGVYTPGSTYTFLKSAGGVSVVSTPRIIENIANIRVMPFVDPLDFGLVFVRDVPFASLGRTYNQRMWGHYFDWIKNDPNLAIKNLRNVLDMFPSDADIRHAMDQMTGEIYGTMAISEVQNLSNVFSLLSFQTRNELSGCQPWYNDVWYLGYGSGGTAKNDGNAHDARLSNWGQVVGWTESPDCDTHYGMFLNIANQKVRSNAVQSRGQIQSDRLGMFFARTYDAGYTSATGLFGWNNINVRRQIQFGPYNSITHSNAHGWQGGFNLEQGGNLQAGPVKIQPYGNLQYINVNQNGATESGDGLFELRVGSRRVNSFRTRLGSRVNVVNIKNAFYCDLNLAWTHEYANNFANYNAFFLSGSHASFNARGLNLGRDWINLGPRIRASFGRLNLYGSYQAAINGNYVLNTGSGSAEITW